MQIGLHPNSQLESQLSLNLKHIRDPVKDPRQPSGFIKQPSLSHLKP